MNEPNKENHNVLFSAFDLTIFRTLILTRHVFRGTQSVYRVAAKKNQLIGFSVHQNRN